MFRKHIKSVIETVGVKVWLYPCLRHVMGRRGRVRREPVITFVTIKIQPILLSQALLGIDMRKLLEPIYFSLFGPVSTNILLG